MDFQSFNFNWPFIFHFLFRSLTNTKKQNCPLKPWIKINRFFSSEIRTRKKENKSTEKQHWFLVNRKSHFPFRVIIANTYRPWLAPSYSTECAHSVESRAPGKGKKPQNYHLQRKMEEGKKGKILKSFWWN